MAVADAPAPSTRLSHANSDLTDAEISSLLARATARLKAKNSSTSASSDVLKLDDNTAQSYDFPKLSPGDLANPYVSQTAGLASLDARGLVKDEERRQATGGARRVMEPGIVKKMAEEKKTATAGKNWFDLPRTNLTPELKRDLQLIKMRGVLDPHRHYKKDGGKMRAPDYTQVGTIVEGPTEFFSGRIENKKRKRTFVEEVLAGEQQTGRFKRRYGELQTKKTSGKMAFYKALKAARKTGGVRKFGK